MEGVEMSIDQDASRCASPDDTRSETSSLPRGSFAQRPPPPPSRNNDAPHVDSGGEGEGLSAAASSSARLAVKAKAEKVQERWNQTRGRSVRADAGPPESRVVTYGRRMSRFLARYGWYNPRGLDGRKQADSDGEGEGGHDRPSTDAMGKDQDFYADDETPLPQEKQEHRHPEPSLEEAWKFYEYVTLPRYLVNASSDDGDSDGDNVDGDAGAIDGAGQKKKDRKKAKERCNNSGASSPSVVLGGDGEKRSFTALYNVWTTTETDLSEFGIGVSLYFWSLRVMAVLMVLAGLITLPNMLYFASTSYSALGQGGVRESQLLLVGSAICTDQVWVACPTCPDPNDFDRNRGGRWVNTHESTPDRFAVSTDDSNLRYILQNKCSIGQTQGLLMWIPVVVLMVSLIIIQEITSKWVVKRDKSVQTADDYTLQVRNPPGDARDPDEWRDFFAQFVRDEDGGHITCCTVALDNLALLRKLTCRRLALRQLELLIEPGVAFDPDDLDAMVEQSLPVPRWKRVVLLAPDASKLRERIDALGREIQDLGNEGGQPPPPSNVYVTFETEHSMQRSFEALSIPKRLARKGDISKAVDVCSESTADRRWWRKCFRTKKLASEDLLFRGEHILHVERPPDPTNIRWEDLSVKWSRIILEQVFTFLIFAGLTVAGCFLVIAAYRNTAWSAITISALNGAIPFIVKKMISLFESHRTVGSLQASIYAKVSAFRWVNTAIITLLITPFTDTLSFGEKYGGGDYIIPKVYAIFFAEMWMGPIMSITDFCGLGHFNRHFLGPRAPDQWRMNLLFGGGYYTLAERMTVVTKLVFLACWYSAIFPAGFFFAAVALLINYASDKFCLLRVWAPAPRLGTVLTRINQSFFTIAIVLYSFAQAYAISGFPYDNACESNSTVSVEYVNGHSAITGDGQTVSISIEEGDSNYLYCHQDFKAYKDGWPPDPEKQPDGEEWMTDGQATATKIAGIIANILVTQAATFIFLHYRGNDIRESFVGAYVPSGEPVDDKFSDQKEMAGYVPQTSLCAGFIHPFLACDVSKIDPKLIGWTSDKPFDAHNLWCDFPSVQKCFSVIRHWPPVGNIGQARSSET